MSYVRIAVKEEFHKWGKVPSKHILTTKAVDIKYEQFCIETYLKIIQKLSSALESKSSLESDLTLLDDPKLDYKNRFAIIYRS